MTIRTALLALLLIDLGAARAQDYERVEVVTVDSTKSAADLYRAADRYFVDAFKEASRTIQFRNEAEHMIVGRVNTTVVYQYGKVSGSANPIPYAFLMEFQAKQGRFRVRFYQMTLEGAPYRDEPCCWRKCDGGGETFRQSMYSVCAQALDIQTQLLDGLKAAMVSPKASDW